MQDTPGSESIFAGGVAGVDGNTNLGNVRLLKPTYYRTLGTLQFDADECAPVLERLFLLFRGGDVEGFLHEQVGARQPLLYFVR